MEITIKNDNGTIITVDNTGFIVNEPPPYVRQVRVNTMTPHDNWVNKLAEKAEAIVSSFHYEGRDPKRFTDDMKIKHFRDKLWGQIVELAEALKSEE